MEEEKSFYTEKRFVREKEVEVPSGAQSGSVGGKAGGSNRIRDASIGCAHTHILYIDGESLNYNNVRLERREKRSTKERKETKNKE